MTSQQFSPNTDHTLKYQTPIQLDNCGNEEDKRKTLRTKKTKLREYRTIWGNWATQKKFIEWATKLMKTGLNRTVSGHFTPKTFHPRTFHPGTFHPKDISPRRHFTPRTFHPTDISPHVRFTPLFEKRIQ